jgi:hypothetical protein
MVKKFNLLSGLLTTTGERRARSNRSFYPHFTLYSIRRISMKVLNIDEVDGEKLGENTIRRIMVYSKNLMLMYTEGS